MTFAARNLEVLAAYHPDAHGALLASPRHDPEVAVERTPSGFPTATFRGVLLHSRYAPYKEAAEQVEREVDQGVTAGIILGFGLGYLAEAFRARFPDVPLLVVEPEMEVFRAALESRDLTRLLSDGSTYLLIGTRPEEIAALLPNLPLEKPAFLRLRPAVEKSPSWFRAAEEVARSFLLRREININTLNRFGKLWVKNLSRNIRVFLESPGISRLAGVFSGIPSLVIAGGPSFDAIVPSVKELSRRFLVVAVNTALSPCLRAGVEPDFTVVVDPQYWASRCFDWTSGFRGMVVAEPSTHPRIFRAVEARFLLCSSLFPLGERLEAVVGKKGKLGAGGSVATSAWDLCRHLGAQPIHVAGLDLGFPGMRTHCRGVFFEDLWFSGSGRISPVEGRSFRYLREIGIFPVRSARGGVAWTDRRMLLYKWWFENQIAIDPSVKSFTLSPDSAAIEGMELVTLENTLVFPVVRPQIDARMRSVEEMRVEGRGGEDALGLAQALEEVREGLAELEGLSRDAMVFTEKLGELLSRNEDPGACLAELQGIDLRILDVSSRNIAGFLMQPLIQGIQGSGDRKASRREILETSAEMYREIRESSRFQRELLERALRSLSVFRPQRFSC